MARYTKLRKKKTFSDLYFQKKLINNLVHHGLKSLIVTGTYYEYGKTSGKIVKILNQNQ